PHRVLRLLEAHGGDLRPGVRLIRRDRLTADHVVDAARTERLDEQQTGSERALPPALKALQRPSAEQPPAVAVDRIPPQHEPGLLHGDPPRPTRAVLQLGPAPAEHVPADGALGQQPVTALELPGRPDPHRLPPAATPRHLRRLSE